MKVFAVALAILAVASAIAAPAVPNVTADTRSDHLILRVGTIDEMKTRNPLHPIAADPWTEDVLARVYEGVLLRNPVTDGPMAYIAKGIDADGDGLFEPASEYDVWEEAPGASTPLAITGYYDFNGVRWHDGARLTVWDLFFSYHLGAMHPRFNESLKVLFCAQSATYDACDRQLNVALGPKNWEGEGAIPGDPALRVALTFTLNEPFVRFDKTLSPRLLPMHVWSRTGGGRHLDFGCAIWIPPEEATSKGLTECGTTDAARWGRGVSLSSPVPGSHPFEFGTNSGAVFWSPQDQDVIGHGPFRFRSWADGSVLLDRNNFYYNGTGYDSRLSRVLSGPRIDSIEIRLFKSAQLAVFALENGDIDYLRPQIPGEFIPRLTLCCDDVAFTSSANPSLFYLAYNMRRQPWGYRNMTASDDPGHVLRQAIAHLIDRKAFVTNLLQNFGVLDYGTISPANTFWYNHNI